MIDYKIVQAYMVDDPKFIDKLSKDYMLIYDLYERLYDPDCYRWFEPNIFSSINMGKLKSIVNPIPINFILDHRLYYVKSSVDIPFMIERCVIIDNKKIYRYNEEDDKKSSKFIQDMIKNLIPKQDSPLDKKMKFYDVFMNYTRIFTIKDRLEIIEQWDKTIEEEQNKLDKLKKELNKYNIDDNDVMVEELKNNVNNLQYNLCILKRNKKNLFTSIYNQMSFEEKKDFWLNIR